MSEKHIFAIHLSELPPLHALTIGTTLTLSDLECWHRINNVLHLRQGETCILFDGEKKLSLTLQASPKKGVVSGVIDAIEMTTPIKPALHLYQGLLKREAFNDVIYLAAQMGASSITPLITKKVQRAWGEKKEVERLQKVMIAACEQAKQYAIPVINQPVELSQLAIPPYSPDTFSLFCQPDGAGLFECLQSITTHHYQAINVFIGPEGGFVQEEQALLNTSQVKPCSLTPSILRSQEAVAVCLGAIRSVAH